MPNLLIEEDFGWPYKFIAGVDEAGRGPWAGPVVSAAVVLDKKNIPSDLDDSKKVSEKRRQSLYSSIYDSHFVGVGISSIEEIDNLNILQATFLSMKRALNNLDCSVDVVLVDGNLNPGFDYDTECIVKGDSISLSIAAASIIAKVTRDNLMSKIDEEFPNYNWKKNKGYGTKEHIELLQRYKPCEIHRKTFKPVSSIL